MNPLKISSCEIIPNKLILNNSIIYEDNNLSSSEFLKSLYSFVNLNYPKFFKMDNLSKLGLLAAEVLIRHQPLTNNHCGVVLMNKNSSIEMDLKHYETIKNEEEFFPSPAYFVYTLPNICVGEICIKHKLSSENIFFINEIYDEDFLTKYAENLIETHDCSSVLIGWIESVNETFEVKMLKLDKNN